MDKAKAKTMEKMLSELVVMIGLNRGAMPASELKNWLSDKTTTDLQLLLKACSSLEAQTQHSILKIKPEIMRQIKEAINAEIRERGKQSETNTRKLNEEHKTMLDHISKRLNAGDDPDRNTGNGRRYLHFTAMFDEKPAWNVTERLINAGATVDIQDDEGYTPLFNAAINNAVETARLLLTRGALPDIINNEGIAPIHMAVGNNCHDMVELLLEYKADRNKKGGYSIGRLTPIEMAKKANYSKILSLLEASPGKTAAPPKQEIKSSEKPVSKVEAPEKKWWMFWK